MFKLSFNEGFDGFWETWGIYDTREDAEYALSVNAAREIWSWSIDELED